MDEHQIYRIDHYLGKETVQNILVLRFANGMFEPIWNRNHIDHVQITVDEKLGVGHRGSFYDATGALRDMVPNHLFQLLSLVAMEPPSRFDAHAVRSEKAEVLSAIQPQSQEEALKNSVRGQYRGGKVGDTEIEDYRKTEDVKPGSTTETYAALKLTIDNWRWAGVPFYLRTGKALGVKRTEIAIKFKQAPFAMFRDTPVDKLSQNYLVISTEPVEGIELQFNTKVPGPAIDIDGVEMKFRYKDYFKAEPSTGYETLIYDCMIGDNILFQRADSVEAGWQAVQPFLDAWKKAGAKGLEDLRCRQRRARGSGRAARPRRPQLAQADLTMAANDQRKLIAVADAAALARGRRRAPAGADRRQSAAASRSASPADRARSSSMSCWRPRPIAARSRGIACTGSSATSASCLTSDPAQQHGDGARHLPRPLCAAGQHPSDPDRYRESGRSRRALRARAEILLRRRQARSRRGRCSISC